MYSAFYELILLSQAWEVLWAILWYKDFLYIENMMGYGVTPDSGQAPHSLSPAAPAVGLTWEGKREKTPELR